MLHPSKCELYKPQLDIQVHLLSLQASVENIALAHGSRVPSSRVWVCASWSRHCPITAVQGNSLVSFLLRTKDYQELLDRSGLPCDSSLQISSLLSSDGTCIKQILIPALSDSEDLWRGFPKNASWELSLSRFMLISS